MNSKICCVCGKPFTPRDAKANRRDHCYEEICVEAKKARTKKKDILRIQKYRSRDARAKAADCGMGDIYSPFWEPGELTQLKKDIDGFVQAVEKYYNVNLSNVPNYVLI